MTAWTSTQFDAGAGPPLPQRADVLAPSLAEIVSLGLLVSFYLFSNEVLTEAGFFLVNSVGAVWFVLTLAYGAWRMTLTDPIALWTGLFWFRITSAVYFGIGSLTQYFFNDTTLKYMQSYYWVNPNILLKANLISALSVLIFLGTVWIASAYSRPKNQISIAVDKDDHLLFICSVTFAGIGYFIKYAILLPYNFGMFGNIVLPGMLLGLSYLAIIGLFLLTIWSVRHAPKYLFIPTVLLFSDMVTGVLQFAKGQVILPLIVFVLALLQSRISFRRLIIGGAVVILTFQTIVPMVVFGRGQLLVQYGNISEGTLSDRLQIMTTYVLGGDTAGTSADFQGSLARISYITSVAAAITLHDGGQPGDSLMNTFTILIPRFLWPDKPIYNIGSQFSQAVSGGAGDSASWMGIFAESYWNLGWAGLPAVMIPLALMYVMLGRMTLAVMARGKWLHFPVVLFAMFMGMRVDGDFTQDQFASAVICVLVYFIASAIDPLVRSFLHGSPANPVRSLAR